MRFCMSYAVLTMIILHVDGSVDPIRDKETIDLELQLKDLETVEKRLEKVSRAARTGNKEAIKEKEVLDKLTTDLQQRLSSCLVDF